MSEIDEGMFLITIENSNVAKVMKVVPTDKSLNIIPDIYSSTSDFVLTSREREVLKLIIEGKSNSEIAKDLIISVHTAKAHVCSIFQKLSVTDRVQAAVKAVRNKLV